MVAIGAFCVESFGSLGTAVTPTAWLILIAPCSFSLLLSLFISTLLISGWEETRVGLSCGALKGWETPFSLS